MRGRGAWLALLAIALVLAIVFGNRSPSRETLPASPRDVSASAQRTAGSPASSEREARVDARPSATGGGKGFRSAHLLDEHFAKHGAEFGRISEQEYLREAQSLRDAPAGGSVEELRRPDGTVSRFDRQSGAFIAFDADGTIRTFFKPNDGESYFRRQAGRAHR